MIPADEPKRIQRKRTKGWKMPENAVYVGRPSMFGNPFKLVRAASKNNGALDMWGVVCEGRLLVRWDTKALAAKDATDRFRQFMRGNKIPMEELRGWDLACWCPLDQPCHADVLLEIANA